LFASVLSGFCYYPLDQEAVAAQRLALQYFRKHLYHITSHMRKGCESWDCPARRREISGRPDQCPQIPEGRCRIKRFQGVW